MPHHDAVGNAIPALAALAGTIGDPAVRHMGTLGGSLANNDPAADYPAAALALGATVHTNQRDIAAEEFFTGLFSTALEEGEIVTRVDFPAPAKAAYEKFRNPASRYAMAGVFVARMKDGSVRVGVTGAGSNGVFRATAIEEALAKSWSPAAVDAVDDRRRRHALRHSRHRRLPRQPRQGDGEAGCGGGGVTASPGG